MAEKVKLTITPVVAAFVRPGTPSETKLSGCTAAQGMTFSDRLMLLFCLSKDADAAVRNKALTCLDELPEEVIRGYLDSSNPHPLVIKALPVVCSNYPPESSPAEEIDDPDLNIDDGEPSCPASEVPDTQPVDEDNEQFLSKYKQAQVMSIAEKIKMALSGDKEWRSILVKDSNKLVSGSVIKNPRISDGEILTLVKSGIQNDEIMRLICANKEWVKVHSIRKALIENNRTPVQNAMRYLGTMGEKDLAQFAKSKNISSVISTMARRLLLNKKK